jgi:hypothetical protein
MFILVLKEELQDDIHPETLLKQKLCHNKKRFTGGGHGFLERWGRFDMFYN